METNYNGGAPQPPAPRPDTYLLWAILATVLCCLPFGIPAIVYASRVNTLYDSGNYEAAADSSRKALRWTLISATLGFFVGVIYFVGVLVGAMNL